jgi:hypothetical protein
MIVAVKTKPLARYNFVIRPKIARRNNNETTNIPLKIKLE